MRSGEVMEEIYLDNAATTKCDPEVAALVAKVLTEEYGNPSALHKKGIDAESFVREAASRIAKTLHCKEKELIFTSGGTESNNLALIGAARANRRAGMHILSTQIEHPSVKKTLAFLEEEGFRVTGLPAGENGILSLKAFEEALDEETILVSVMMVNNEIGSIQPIREIRNLIDRNAPNALLHVDAVQAYGKLPIHVKKSGIDLLSVSGHKLHGPKGVGFLYVKEGTKIRPVSFGGGQQKGMRSGTLNVPGIAGLGLAAEKAYAALSEHSAHMKEMRDLLAALLVGMPDVVLNSPVAGSTAGSGEYAAADFRGQDEGADLCAPHILNVSFPGIRSEVFLHALEAQGIYVSSGSACASHHPSDKSTLMHIGRPKEITDSAIRFSLSRYTTRQEIERTAEAVGELLPVLRKFVRR